LILCGSNGIEEPQAQLVYQTLGALTTVEHEPPLAQCINSNCQAKHDKGAEIVGRSARLALNGHIYNGQHGGIRQAGKDDQPQKVRCEYIGVTLKEFYQVPQFMLLATVLSD